MRTALVTAALLILFAACNSDDPTFMKLCPTGTDFVYPVGDATEASGCDAHVEIKWPVLPLRVRVDAEVAAAYGDSVDGAFDFWKDGTGHTLFVRADESDFADVFITLGSASDPGLAATRHQRLELGLAATIEIRQPGDVVEMKYVLAHELGHVLGLAHDPGQTSIMHRSIEDVGLDGNDEGFPNLWVTDADADAINSRYF